MRCSAGAAPGGGDLSPRWRGGAQSDPGLSGRRELGHVDLEHLHCEHHVTLAHSHWSNSLEAVL